MIELLRYQREDGHEPLTVWLASIRDKAMQARIRMRLLRLESGNYGDCEPVGEGVLELRIHIGPGYRVYCAPYCEVMVLLLHGGDKHTQSDDIKHAKRYWAEWKRRQT